MRSRRSASAPAGIGRRWADGVAALVGVGVFALCAVIVRDGTVGAVETRVFRAINDLPDALSPAMRSAQLLGVLVVGPLVAVGALVLRRSRLALAALLVTAGKLVTERMVWEMVQRSRPGTTIPGAVVRGDTPAAGVSFVSGHVMLTTALAWVMTPYLRGPWRALPWAVAAVVAFARVYLGAHAPLDVVGGIALGVTLGGIANLVVGVPTRAADPEPDRAG